MRVESCQVTNERPRKETICAVIVSFYPDSGLFARIERVTGQVDRAVIVDNGSSASCACGLRMLAERLRVHMILNARNEGIARALNQGIGWAQEQGYSWALTLDQDTVVGENVVKTLCGVYEDFPDKERLAVIGSNFTDPVRRRPFLVDDPNDDCSWREVAAAITSGSLTSLPAYRAVGPFREELFIDCVDFEYCLRARSRGLRIIMAPKALIEHSIGRMTLHKLPWKMSGTTNHPPIRRYYMTRNHLLLAREYLRREPIWTLSALYSHFKTTIQMCLFEEDLLRKAKYIALGVLDGLISNYNRKLT